MRLVDYTTKSVTSYRLGAGNLLVIASLIPGIYLLLGYRTYPTIAFQSLITIIITLAALAGRDRINTIGRISPQPRFTGLFAQILISIFTFITIGLANRALQAKLLASLATTTTDTVYQTAILAQTAIAENLVIHYMLFTSLWIFAILAFKHYDFAALGIAIPLSTAAGYVFHTWVYPILTDASTLNFVAISFAAMGIQYWLTGNIVAVILIHVFWDTGQLMIALAFPTLCPGLWGLC